MYVIFVVVVVVAADRPTRRAEDAADVDVDDAVDDAVDGTMRVRALESLLSSIAPFERPKQWLEQYPTNAALAAGVLHHARHRGDVDGRLVCDLGCGCGMLSAAAVLCDAGGVIGVDVDEEALETCRENLALFEPALEAELVRADVAVGVSTRREGGGGDEESGGDDADGARSPVSRLRCDTVVMNPPFGTRRTGADVAFLRAAFRIATGAIYSLHKTSTRAHIEKVAMTKFHAREAEVLAQLKYDLPATYAHHREKSVEIAVDLWRFVPSERSAFIEDEEEEEGDGDDIDALARDVSRKARVGGGRGRGRGGARGRGRGGRR